MRCEQTTPLAVYFSVCFVKKGCEKKVISWIVVFPCFVKREEYTSMYISVFKLLHCASLACHQLSKVWCRECMALPPSSGEAICTDYERGKQ